MTLDAAEDIFREIVDREIVVWKRDVECELSVNEEGERLK